MTRVDLSKCPDSKTVEKNINILGRYRCAAPFVIGRSTLGKPVYALAIGRGEESVLYAGAFHGLEWMTSLVLMRFAESLCISLDNRTALAGTDIYRDMKNRRVIIVPVVNPDSVDMAAFGIRAAGRFEEAVREISNGDMSQWQANVRGVDINHNFDAGWEILHQIEQDSGIIGPSCRRYGGAYPESECETRNVTALCRRISFEYAFAFHSQGEEIYWSYGEHTPPASRFMAKLLSAVSGYELSSPEKMASHGGFKDWFIETFSRPAFTIEIGKGKNPLPMGIFESVYSSLLDMLVAGLLL